jgi:hypothetical protein
MASITQFGLTVQLKGSLRAQLEAAQDQISDQLRRSVQKVSLQLRNDLRGQVRGAGLGVELEKAWDREVYPKAKKRTFHPLGLVFSKSALHGIYDQSATVIPRRGSYLVIPLPEAIKRGLHTTTVNRKGGRVTGDRLRRKSVLADAAAKLGAIIVSTPPPGRRQGGGSRRGQFRKYLLLVPAKKPGNLVAVFFGAPGAKGVPLFTLVKQTTVRKRLDIAGAANKAAAALAAAVEGEKV